MAKDDERSRTVTGNVIHGGSGGIHVGGNMNIGGSGNVTNNESLSERDRRLVQDVLDAARLEGPTVPLELVVAVRDLDEAIAAELPRRSRVRRSLEQVALHAGTAGAVFAAAQVALEVLK